MTIGIDTMERSAQLSADGVYRYSLERVWRRSAPRVVFVMLNPSTADGTVDDATIRRCVGYARRWGHGGIRVVNLYALRSRDPGALRDAADPVGPGNDQVLFEAAREGRDRGYLCVAAWGANADVGRAVSVAWTFAEVGARLRCFGLTSGGHPLHPLAVGLTRESPLVEFDASVLVAADRRAREAKTLVTSPGSHAGPIVVSTSSRPCLGDTR